MLADSRHLPSRPAPRSPPSRGGGHCGVEAGLADGDDMAIFSTKPATTPTSKAAAPAASKAATLTADERALLGRLEAAVEAGLPHVSAMVEAGKALAEIRDRQLYRATAATFAVYLKDRYGLTPRRATQLIQFAGLHADVAEIVGEDAAATITERAVRPLSGLADEDRRDAIREAAADGLAPAAIAKAASKRRRSKRPPRPVRLKVPGGIVVVEINRKGMAAGATVEAILAAAVEAVRREAAGKAA